MNKTIIFSFIILLSVVGVLPTAAQQCFNNRYTLHSGASIISGALEYKGKYYSTAISLDSINYISPSVGYYNIWGIHFTSYDSVGRIIKDSLYQRADRVVIDTWSNNLSVLSDGSFLLAAQSADTAVKNGFYIGYTNLIRYDSNGHVLMFKEYARPECSILDATIHNLFDMQSDKYGNWLMLSSVICNGKVRFCLRKLDKDFNEVWVKLYATNIMSHTPKHLLIEPDGYVMSGGIDNDNIMPYRANYYSSVLIKCDTAGDTLWSWHNKFDTTRLQYTINDIIRTKDGGYVYCGTGEGVPTYRSGSSDWSGIETKGWVEKLDASRNSVWSKSLSPFRTAVDYAQQTVLRELSNGDIMVAGVSSELLDKKDTTKKGWERGSLSRLSGIDGKVLWQHYYGSPDANDTMRMSFYDMRPTSDGGYILAGEALNLIDRNVGPIQRGWLVKVDSNGCVGKGDPQCWLTSIGSESLPVSNFILYPNPSSGKLVINDASLQVKQSESLSIKVYDLLGRVVYEQSLILNKAQTPLELNLAKGTYILELRTEDAVQRERIVIQ